MTVLSTEQNMPHTYLHMDSATDLILDNSLVKQIRSTMAMEKEGLRRSLDKLLGWTIYRYYRLL